MSRAAEPTAAERAAGGCAVCGSRAVRTDAVAQRGWLLLAECPRCDHRWTQPLPDAPMPALGAVRVAARRGRSEVASAA